MEAQSKFELIKKIHTAENLLANGKKQFMKAHKEKCKKLTAIKLALLDEVVDEKQSQLFDDDYQLSPELTELIENPLSP